MQKQTIPVFTVHLRRKWWGTVIAKVKTGNLIRDPPKSHICTAIVKRKFALQNIVIRRNKERDLRRMKFHSSPVLLRVIVKRLCG